MRHLCVTLMVCALAALTAAADEPTPNSLFLDGDFEFKVQASGEVIVTWQTVEPCPRGILWLGLVSDDAVPGFVHFRRGASMESGEGMTTEHRATFSATGFERDLYDIASLRERGGGTIHLRWVTWSPGGNRTEIFHTQVGYARDEAGVYRRVPCFTLGPVIDCVTDSSAIVSWETDLPAHWEVGTSPIVRSSFMYGTAGTSTSSEDPSTGGEVEIRFEPVEEREEGAVFVRYQGQGYWVMLNDSESGERLPTSFTEGRFSPAPAAGADEPFEFAVMSDSRAGTGGGLTNVQSTNWEAVRQLMTGAYRAGADVILFAGDLVNGYSASVLDTHRQLRSWRHAVAPVGALVPIYEGMGNHEYCGHPHTERPGRISHSYTDERAPERLFSENFVNPENGPGPEDGADVPPYAETVYSFDWGNAHFVSINSNYHWSSRPGSEQFPGNREGFIMPGQMAWLDADLAAARERGQEHLFVYTHEPMFPNGGHVGDSMYWNGRIPEVLEMRAQLAEILSRHGVCAILHGDEHNYSRMLVTGEVCETVERPFWQIVSGGAGAPFYGQQDVPWREHVEAFSTQNHFVFFEVDGEDVTARAISRTGQVLDEADLTDVLEDWEPEEEDAEVAAAE